MDTTVGQTQPNAAVEPASVSPMDLLPTELLIQILLELAVLNKPSSDGSVTVTRRSRHAQYVCSKWYDIVQNVPSFWTGLHLRVGEMSSCATLALAERCWERSEHLDVHLDFRGPSHDDIHVLAFIHKAAPKVRSLEVTLEHNRPTVIPLPFLPSLQTIHLVVHNGPGPRTSGLVMSSIPARLKTLVHKITIEGSSGYTLPTSSFPNVRELIMNDGVSSMLEEPYCTEDVRIMLPNVRYLELNRVSVGTCMLSLCRTMLHPEAAVRVCATDVGLQSFCGSGGLRTLGASRVWKPKGHYADVVLGIRHLYPGFCTIRFVQRDSLVVQCWREEGGVTDPMFEITVDGLLREEEMREHTRLSVMELSAVLLSMDQLRTVVVEGLPQANVMVDQLVHHFNSFAPSLPAEREGTFTLSRLEKGAFMISMT